MLAAAASVAAPWYTSGTFWAIISVAVTALFGAIGALVAYYATPRYQLFYDLPFCASLLAAPENARKDIKVSHSGIELHNPYVLKVRLVSRSRADIPSRAFDQGRPIVLDVGIPIVAQLSGDDEGGGLNIRCEGSKLVVGPDLIGKRQEATFTLLADGYAPALTCESYLVNVKVRRQPNAEHIIGKIGKVAAFPLVALLAILAILTFVNGNAANRMAGWVVSVPAVLMCAFVVAIVVLKRRYPS